MSSCILHYEKFADGTVKCIEDEIPFDLPEGWVWSRLISLTTKIGAGSTPTGGASVYSKSGIKFIRSQNVYNDGLILEDIVYISNEINSKKTGSIVKPKDLLLNITGGSVGRCALVPDEFDIANVNQHVMIIRLADLSLRRFIHSMLISPYIQQQIFTRQVGSGRGGLSAETLSTFLIPIPPLHEQFLIQKKIDQCILDISSIALKGKELTRALSMVKSKILDLAIRGKLVPQNPQDEPASVLLERIRAEKEELIRQGKIKRDKKESVIFKGEDNSYYDEVPENWAVLTLNQLTHPLLLNDGDWILSENMNTQGEIKLIQLGSVGMMRYVDKGFKYLTESTFQELNCTQIYPGYMLINRIVSDKMCSCILPTIEGKLITTVDTCWVAPKDEWYNLKYLMYTLSSTSFQSLVMLNSTGTTRKRISKNNLINLPFAFPPLDEQQRIVEAIETVFAQLDAIAQSLN